MQVKQLGGRIQAGTQNKGKTLIRDEPQKHGSMVLFKVFLILQTDCFQNMILVSSKEFLFVALEDPASSPNVRESKTFTKSL